MEQVFLYINFNKYTVVTMLNEDFPSSHMDIYKFYIDDNHTCIIYLPLSMYQILISAEYLLNRKFGYILQFI